MTKVEAAGMAQTLKGLAKRGDTAPLAEYRALPDQEQKRMWLMRFKVDKKCTFVQRTERREEGTQDEQEFLSGWMSMEHITFLKLGITAAGQDPEAYKKLCMACVADLEPREHIEPALAALGQKQYLYTREGFQAHKQIKTNVSGIQGHGDIVNDKAADVLGLGNGSASGSGVTLLVEEWAQEYINGKAAVEKSLKRAGKMANDLKSFCDNLDKTNALQAAVAEERVAKIKTFQTYFDARAKGFVDFRSANGEDESAQQSKLIAVIHDT